MGKYLETLPKKSRSDEWQTICIMFIFTRHILGRPHMATCCSSDFVSLGTFPLLTKYTCMTRTLKKGFQSKTAIFTFILKTGKIWNAFIVKCKCCSRKNRLRQLRGTHPVRWRRNPRLAPRSLSSWARCGRRTGEGNATSGFLAYPQFRATPRVSWRVSRAG